MHIFIHLLRIFYKLLNLYYLLLKPLFDQPKKLYFIFLIKQVISSDKK